MNLVRVKGQGPLLPQVHSSSASCLANWEPGPLSTLHTRTPVACRQHSSDRVRKHEELAFPFGRSVKSGCCGLGGAIKATSDADHSRTVLGPRRWGKRRTCACGRESGPGTHSKPRSRSPRHRDSSRSAHETAVSIGLVCGGGPPLAHSPREGPGEKRTRPRARGVRLLFSPPTLDPPIRAVRPHPTRAWRPLALLTTHPRITSDSGTTTP